MEISRLTRHALGTFTAAAVLTGCGNGSGAQFGAPLSRSGAVATGRAFTMGRPDRGRSWMAPDTKKRDLLYVSDSFPYGSNDVYVYSYPKGKLKGTLTGFNEPSGQCVDKAGDVFIANFGASQILEYAHGGTSPIKTLSDPDYYPLGCSVDPTTGNLAVTNRLSTSFTAGDVAIYADASGTPTSYTAPNF
jgi:hypothetical protein